MFINSGFFAAVTAHDFIMKRFKRLGKSKGFQISVLIFLMVFLAFMLVISLLTNQHPTKDMPGAFLLFIPLTLLFPFFIAILGYSKSIGMFTKVRPMPEKSEIAFFIGVLVYSVFAYLISIFVLIILVSNIDNPLVQLAAIDFTLGFFLTIYYFTSILGVLSVGSMRVIKMMVEEKDKVLADMKEMKQELKREMKL